MFEKLKLIFRKKPELIIPRQSFEQKSLDIGAKLVEIEKNIVILANEVFPRMKKIDDIEIMIQTWVGDIKEIKELIIIKNEKEALEKINKIEKTLNTERVNQAFELIKPREIIRTGELAEAMNIEVCTASIYLNILASQGKIERVQKGIYKTINSGIVDL